MKYSFFQVPYFKMAMRFWQTCVGGGGGEEGSAQKFAVVESAMRNGQLQWKSKGTVQCQKCILERRQREDHHQKNCQLSLDLKLSLVAGLVYRHAHLYGVIAFALWICSSKWAMLCTFLIVLQFFIQSPENTLITCCSLRNPCEMYFSTACTPVLFQSYGFMLS